MPVDVQPLQQEQQYAMQVHKQQSRQDFCGHMWFLHETVPELRPQMMVYTLWSIASLQL